MVIFHSYVKLPEGRCIMMYISYIRPKNTHHIYRTLPKIWWNRMKNICDTASQDQRTLGPHGTRAAVAQGWQGQCPTAVPGQKCYVCVDEKDDHPASSCFILMKLCGNLRTYCWWKKSCTALDGWNPTNNGINHLSTGVGFLPSTVVVKGCQGFWHGSTLTQDPPKSVMNLLLRVIASSTVVVGWWKSSESEFVWNQVTPKSIGWSPASLSDQGTTWPFWDIPPFVGQPGPWCFGQLRVQEWQSLLFGERNVGQSIPNFWG